MVELQLNQKIKEVQIDWGGEFRPFNPFLNSLGIHHRIICPHTHQKNGLVECKHRHIVDIGFTLLSQASLPLKFWDHAFNIVVYLINRLPTPTPPHTVPYSTIFIKHYDYNFLNTFGCACYPHTRPYHTHKLQFRSTPCTFLGYSSCHKGYKCLDVHGKLFISKDVIFDESTFPFLSQTLSPTPLASHSRTIPLRVLPNVGPPSPIQHASPTSSDVSLVSPLISPSTNTTRSSPLPPPIVPSTSSTHPMQTRSKLGIIKPKQYPIMLLVILEPASFKHALSSPIWRTSIQEEYDALMANNTWTLTSLPPG